MGKDKPEKTCGTQKKKGKAPNLIRREEKISIEKFVNLKIPVRNIRPEIVWIRKYFKADSFVLDDLNFTKIGISPISLSSIAIHNEIINVDLRANKIENKINEKYRIKDIIRRLRHSRGMNPIA